MSDRVRDVGRKQKGVTLVELMIVVIIIGILAGVAVFMFSKQATRARSSEVHIMFAEISTKQEAFITENGEPASVSDELLAFLPRGTPSDTPRPVEVPDRSWADQLRINFSSPALYCSYYTHRYDVEDFDDLVGFDLFGDFFANNVAEAQPFYDARAGSDNNYIMAARCDFDGDGIQSQYLKASWHDETLVDKPGE